MNKAQEVLDLISSFKPVGTVGNPKTGCEILWDATLNRVRIIPMNMKTGIVLTTNDFKRLAKTNIPY